MADAPLWLQVLGPVATIGASIVAGTIAVRLGRAQVRINEGQRQIAASQRDIAKMKIRMDLHDRRYEILAAARELMIGAIPANADKARMVQLQRVLLGCRFLFPAHIAKVAEEIRSACIDASVLGLVGEPSQATLDSAHAAQLKVARFLDQWPAPFSEVMTFRDVD